jgi:hypothetical protein
MKKTRTDYRRGLAQAAEPSAVRILTEARTGVLYPHFETVRLLREAWLARHKAARQEQKE